MITNTYPEIDTQLRRDALETFIKSEWLDKATLRANLAWLGYGPSDPKNGKILYMVGKITKEALRHKVEHPNTRFARAMRLSRRLPRGEAKYVGEVALSAASIKLVLENERFLKKVWGLDASLERTRKLEATREFIKKLESKFIQTTAWMDQPIDLQTFAQLGLTPDELMEAEQAYGHLIVLVKAVAKRPNLSVVTGFDEMYALQPMQTYGYDRRRLPVDPGQGVAKRGTCRTDQQQRQGEVVRRHAGCPGRPGRTASSPNVIRPALSQDLSFGSHLPCGGLFSERSLRGIFRL